MRRQRWPRALKAALVWMDQRPLERNRRYLLKHTSQTVPAFVTIHRASHRHRHAGARGGGDAGDERHRRGHARLLRPIALDLYGENRATGAFILIDPETNSTVAAGMITAARGVQRRTIVRRAHGVR